MSANTFSELVSAKEGAGKDGLSTLPTEDTRRDAIISVSSKSEDESQSSAERFVSASASSTGSALSSGSGRGPVAHRERFPLEDEEVRPRWNALLAVNPSIDSDEEGTRTGYESDDDFENMDAEMRRLEEKLRKFERELGISSGEDLSTEVITTVGAEPRHTEDSASAHHRIPRLRQEDIDVLKSFSLPDVYPPVSLLKTKHISLMKDFSSLFGEDSDHDCSFRSTDSSQLVVLKSSRKPKPGERRVRSLDLQKLCRTKVESKISADNLTENIPQTGKDNDDVISSKVDEFRGSTFQDQEEGCAVPPFKELFEINKEESPLIAQETAVHEQRAPSHEGDFFSMNESQYGYLWREEESEMTALDFEALESFNDPEQRRDSLFFIFEDDDDDDAEEYDFYFNELIKLDETNALPPKDEFSAHYCQDFAVQETKKRDTSLVTAFKNSFRKAAKYLGPNPFKPKEEYTEDACFTPSHQPPPANRLVNTTCSSQDAPTEPSKCQPDQKFSGKYNVRTAQVCPHSPIDSDSGEISFGSGEYHATPALCVLSSDEDRSQVSHTDTEQALSPTGTAPEALYQNVSAKIDRTQSGHLHFESSTKTLLPFTSQAENVVSTLSEPSNHISSEKPPPVPPRRSVLISNALESGDQAQTLVKREEPPEAPPRNHPSHKPTSVKQLKRKHQERIESQRAEDACETVGCTFCIGVASASRGRPDQAGNHDRHPSPHPRALPERRTWPPRVSVARLSVCCSLPHLQCVCRPRCPPLPSSNPQHSPDGSQPRPSEGADHRHCSFEWYSLCHLTSHSSLHATASFSSSSSSSRDSEPLWVPRPPVPPPSLVGVGLSEGDRGRLHTATASRWRSPQTLCTSSHSPEVERTEGRSVAFTGGSCPLLLLLPEDEGGNTLLRCNPAVHSTQSDAHLCYSASQSDVSSD